ncbi:MAG: ABC transporter permease [Chloroflexi bacterium]|nr:ABC transporter permease [Chloroflexota bacterium]
MFAALVILVTIIGTHNGAFVRPENLLDLVASNSFFGMIALATVFLLALGEIDLSVGWNFNFSAVIAALAMVHGVDPWLAAGLGVLFGAGLGLVNGVLAVGLQLPVIIVTLGTFSMFQGLSLVVNKSSAVVPPDISGSFFATVNKRIGSLPLIGGVPFLALLFVALAVVLHVLLHRTRFGYRVLAIGSNAEAARLAGIPLARTRVLVLVLVGAFCGLAGSLYVGSFGSVDPASGGQFLLAVVAAVIIGGTPLSGGMGTVIGALIGVLIIATISSGIIFFGIDATWSTFVTGAVIIIAVAVDQAIKWQRRRNAERRATRNS